ncbi:amidohydrolase family protein [Streptomyces sp. NPDC003710]
MARAEGARALGLGDRLGSLEGGERADLMLLDLGRPHLRPRHDVWSTPRRMRHSVRTYGKRSSTGGS